MWRYAVERNAWWRDLIIAKCGVGSSSWLPIWNLGHSGRSVWCWVIKFRSCFWNFGYLDPGGGACSFWFDFWVPGVSLSEAYPRIAAAARCRDSFISDIVSLSPRRSWQIPLNNTLRGGAWREWQHLLNRLEELPEDLITAGPAFIVWPLEASARFSVASLRRQLVDESFPGDPSFPHSLIWIKEVPTKIQGFCWTTFHMKSIDHMFIHCDYSSSVWNRLSSTLSIIGPRSSTIQELFLAWKGLNCVPRFTDAMKVLLHAYCWFVWLERNERIFKERSRDSRHTFVRIMLNVGRWMTAADLFSVDRFNCWNNFIYDPG
ncbi:hypothetical protein LINPERHAP1_LOCUS25286 [Linum perenne]